MEDDEGIIDGIDLYELFTTKEYQFITVDIPRFRCAVATAGSQSTVRNNNITHDTEDTATTATSDRPVNGGTGTVTDTLSIKILQSPAACTDPDLTGQLLWPVSRLLSHYLASDCIDLRGKSVLELGAGGTGLPSIVASQCGAATVIATDGNDGLVLDLLRQNMERNGRRNQGDDENDDDDDRLNCNATSTTMRDSDDSQATTTTRQLPPLSHRQLLWGDCDHVRTLRRDMQVYHQACRNHQASSSRHRRRFPTFDFIIAADVVQWPAVLEPLLHTVKAFMWVDHDYPDIDDEDKTNGENLHNDSLEVESPSRFILGIVERSSAIYEQFLSLAQMMGFTYRHIDYKEYLVNGLVPESCQEYGGRVTMLLELSLRSSTLTGDTPLLPVLLLPPSEKQQSNDDNDIDDNEKYVNYTVGESYKHTTFLPC
jgi:predicted nicotinamide N-methyase